MFAGARAEEREQADSGSCRRGLPEYPREIRDNRLDYQSSLQMTV